MGGRYVLLIAWCEAQTSLIFCLYEKLTGCILYESFEHVGDIIKMSEWNYTKCSKPFESAEDALEFMVSNSFDGQVLERAEGYAAVCPTYPEGFYPDARPVAEYSPKTGIIRDESLFGIVMSPAESIEEENPCCLIPVGSASSDSKCC